MTIRLWASAAALTAASLAAPACAQISAPASSILIDRCAAATCTAKLTPDQLLAEAEKLTLAGRYGEARPMLAALSNVPALRVQARFLTGFIAAKTGDHAHAASLYKAILADDPKQTRVRLELAREMLAMGDKGGADRQFKIAEQDKDLPIDVARTIRAVRDVIRSQRAWRLDIDFGIVPDSNINNATGADSVNILIGGGSLPLQLDQNSRARSGTGETASLSGSLRLPMTHKTAALFDLDAAGTNFAGGAYDDYAAQFASGIEVRPSDKTSFSIEGVGAERWFGGHPITTQIGTKIGLQTVLDPSDRIGVQFDLRRTRALFDDDYTGWQGGAYVTYEHAVGKSLLASTSLFVRRDWLRADAYSNVEIGGTIGFGGELSHGLNFGLSGTLSHASYDAPMWLFSATPRHDWRYGARATLGYRKIRVFGFSPQMTLSYSRTDASIPLYANARTRVRFTLARYF